MRSAHLLTTLLLLAPGLLEAGPRASTDYTVKTDTADGGGARATSAAYTNVGTVGTVAGVSAIPVSGGLAKAGYVGQLLETTSVVVSATPSTVNETGTSQLAATQFFDDGTLREVPAHMVAWSVLSGPVVTINSAGLATTGAVYQNSQATVQGVVEGTAGTATINVLEMIPDNYQSYGGDGLGDDWQVQYFGLPPNARAAPGFYSDGSGLTNLFKFTAGLVPNDTSSRLYLTVEPVAGHPDQKTVRFHPTFQGRHYTVKESLGLGSWSVLTGPLPGQDGEMAVLDPTATPDKKFYRIEITKP